MKLYWVDVETTGLDPDNGALLELSMAEAEFSRPFEILWHDTWVFRFEPGNVPMSDFVRDMHTKSGLLGACSLTIIRPHDVETLLLDRIPPSEDKEDMPILAGRTVHFDHAWLKVNMRELAPRFSHRHYNVSAVELFCRSLGMAPLNRHEQHRARPDVLQAIDHARQCARWAIA